MVYEGVAARKYTLYSFILAENKSCLCLQFLFLIKRAR